MSDAESRTPEQIRADIEHTREELGDTVEALAHKTDVKARAQDKKEEIKANVRTQADEVRAKVSDALPGGGGDAAGTGDGTPAAEKASELGSKAAEQAKANRVPLLIAAALLAGYLVGRRRSA